MDWKPQPSYKRPAVDNFLKEVVGVDRKDAITNKTCPFCGTAVTLDSFKDELSLKEFHISGLCSKCQDEMFS